MDDCLLNQDFETLTNEEFKARISKDLAKFKIKDRVVSAEELPKTGFDVYSCISDNHHDFGIITEVEKLGYVVKYIGHSEIKVGDKMLDLHGFVGQVMMQSNGRVVIMIETDYGTKFFGWLNPSDYEIANFPYVRVASYIN